MAIKTIDFFEKLYPNSLLTRLLQIPKKDYDEYKNKNLEKIYTFISDPIMMCHHTVVLILGQDEKTK